MGILDSLKKETQQAETKTQEVVQPQAPVVNETPVEVAKQVDRSAYNCPTCKGEGLVTDHFEEDNLVRCPQCGGTGKV